MRTASLLVGTQTLTFTGTGTLTPSDPYFQNVVLLTHFDNNTVDIKGHALSMGSTGGYGVGKFGKAASFNGTANSTAVLSNASSALGTLSGQFTIEGWVNWNVTPPGRSSGQERQIIGQHNWAESAGTSSTGGWWVLLGVDNGLMMYLATGGSMVTITSSAFTWDTGAWHHVAVTRDASNVVRLFKDGALVGSASTNKPILLDNSRNLSIGADGTGSNVKSSALMDDFRITAGVARYTAPFTPPTAAFPDK